MDGMVDGIFREDLRIVASSGQGFLQDTAANISGKHGLVSFFHCLKSWYTQQAQIARRLYPYRQIFIPEYHE
jgi:hypothetical protein